MSTKTEKSRARDQAKAQLEGIIRMVKRLEHAQECQGGEDARRAIEEDPLSVQVRSGWYSPGEKAEAEEYEILLCTGGPACRIIGDLGAYNQPETAQLEYQDWFTPWERYHIADDEQEKALLTYAQQFYFGE